MGISFNLETTCNIASLIIFLISLTLLLYYIFRKNYTKCPICIEEGGKCPECSDKKKSKGWLIFWIIFTILSLILTIIVFKYKSRIIEKFKYKSTTNIPDKQSQKNVVSQPTVKTDTVIKQPTVKTDTVIKQPTVKTDTVIKQPTVTKPTVKTDVKVIPQTTIKEQPTVIAKPIEPKITGLSVLESDKPVTSKDISLIEYYGPVKQEKKVDLTPSGKSDNLSISSLGSAYPMLYPNTPEKDQTQTPNSLPPPPKPVSFPTTSIRSLSVPKGVVQDQDIKINSELPQIETSNTKPSIPFLKSTRNIWPEIDYPEDTIGKDFRSKSSTPQHTGTFQQELVDLSKYTIPTNLSENLSASRSNVNKSLNNGVTKNKITIPEMAKILANITKDDSDYNLLCKQDKDWLTNCLTSEENCIKDFPVYTDGSECNINKIIEGSNGNIVNMRVKIFDKCKKIKPTCELKTTQ